MNDRQWPNRIVGSDEVPPDSLLANPENWRIHPATQEAALEEVLKRVGWVGRIIVNRTTGHVVDGHLRVLLAIRRDEPLVPVDYVELTEDEERLVLATIDPIAAMAATDFKKLDELIGSIELDPAGPLNAALALLLAEAPPAAEWGEALSGVGAKASPFQTLSFVVTDAQASTIRAALEKAKKQRDAIPDLTDTGSVNTNGNALAFLCAGFVDDEDA